ncbi:hypothetical protein COOONC_17168 [Cooperia oncophora]
MSLKCFPLLYVNMAGEMIYILEQRIKNLRNISEEKGDLVSAPTLFGQHSTQKYLHEYSSRSTCFPEGICEPCLNDWHIQVSWLSESSMEKLFDLTLMMTKYQIQSVVMPEQIPHQSQMTTGRHLKNGHETDRETGGGHPRTHSQRPRNGW